MEKLIELLNEYSKKKHNIAMRELNWELWQWFHYLNYWSSYSELLMVSKKYEFIKRLVDKNKIETNNLSLKAFKNIFSGGWFVEVSDLEVLLMLLAISDTPIDDLISYLK